MKATLCPFRPFPFRSIWATAGRCSGLQHRVEFERSDACGSLECLLLMTSDVILTAAHAVWDCYATVCARVIDLDYIYSAAHNTADADTSRICKHTGLLPAHTCITQLNVQSTGNMCLTKSTEPGLGCNPIAMELERSMAICDTCWASICILVDVVKSTNLERGTNKKTELLQ